MLDAERQVRFLYPPMFFFASMFLGIRLDGDVVIKDVATTLMGDALFGKLKAVEWTATVVAVATAGGLVATIAIGFLISSVTILALRGVSGVRKNSRTWWRSGSYEAVFLPNAEAVRKSLNLKTSGGSHGNADALFLSATLDHELIPHSIHYWVLRRWTMFYVYAHSATALILAFCIGNLIGVTSGTWAALSTIVAAAFICLAAWAWQDTMGMLRFQAQRPLPLRKPVHKEHR